MNSNGFPLVYTADRRFILTAHLNHWSSSTSKPSRWHGLVLSGSRWHRSRLYDTSNDPTPQALFGVRRKPCVLWPLLVFSFSHGRVSGPLGPSGALTHAFELGL